MNEALLIFLYSCGFTSLLGLAIYYVMKKWMQTKSYDEIIEEQKKERGDYFSKNFDGDKKDKMEKKKNRGKKLRDKAKGSDKEELISVNNSEESSKGIKFKPHVEFEPDTEILEEIPKVDDKKQTIHKSPKPILLNKGEAKPVSAISVALASSIKPPVNSFEKAHPKDDFELKHSKQVPVKEKVQVESSKIVKSLPTTIDKPKQVHESISKESVSSTQSSSSTSSAGVPIQAKKSKAKKSEPKELWPGGVVVGSALFCDQLRQSVLNESEIQGLIEILLNKQQEVNFVSTEWIEQGQKTDSVSLLKKRIEQLEKNLEDEHHLAQTATSKLKEIRAELNLEKSRASQLEKSSQQSLVTKQQELRTLQQKLESSQQQNAADVQQLHAKIHQIHTKYGEKMSGLQQDHEERNQLQARFSQLETEYNSKILSLTNELEALKTRETGLLQTEADAQQLVSNLTHQLQEAQRQLYERDQSSHNNLARLQTLEADYNAVMQKLQELQGQSHDSADIREQLEADNKKHLQMISDLSENVKRSHDQTAKQEALRLELESQYRIEQKVSEERQETVERLSEEVNVLKKKLEEGVHSSGQVVQVNGGLTSDDPSFKKIEMLEESVESYRIQNDKMLAEIKSLKEELENQQTKNNELREKNWKVVEALNSAETKAKQLESIKNSIMCNLEKERGKVKEILSRLYPRVHVETVDNYESWLETFEMKASSIQQESLGVSSGTSENLQKEVDYYRSVLTSTETLLKEIQNSVETEENKWKKEIVSVSRDKENLEIENKAYIEKLHQREKLVSELEKKVKQLEVNNLSVTAENNQLKVACDGLNQRMTEHDSQRVIVDQLQQELKSIHSQLNEEKLDHKRLQEEYLHLKGAVNGVAGVECSNNGKSPLLESNISVQFDDQCQNDSPEPNNKSKKKKRSMDSKLKGNTNCLSCLSRHH